MNDFSEVNFLVGINGSGKSRTLNSLGQRYLKRNTNVIAISNTVFDKFSQRGYKKLSAKDGKVFLKYTILDSILTEDNSIYNVLEYLGYEKEFGVLISFYSDFDGDFLEYFLKKIDDYNKFYVPNDKAYIDYSLREIELFCDQLKEFLYPYNEHEYFFHFRYRGNVDGNIKNLSIFRRLYELFSNKKIIKFDFLISKGGYSFKINGASSGESHFLAQILFLSSNLNKSEKNIILIDEPEISLHPKWQKDYIFKLYDYFYMYDLKIFIATHSPLVISKLQMNQFDLYDNYIGRIDYKIFKVKDLALKVIEQDEDFSVESLYWEVFGVLTPDNSFLSRHCVKLLDQLQEGKLSYEFVEQEFQKLIESADNVSQMEVLEDIRKRFLVRAN